MLSLPHDIPQLFPHILHQLYLSTCLLIQHAMPVLLPSSLLHFASVPDLLSPTISISVDITSMSVSPQPLLSPHDQEKYVTLAIPCVMTETLDQYLGGRCPDPLTDRLAVF